MYDTHLHLFSIKNIFTIKWTWSFFIFVWWFMMKIFAKIVNGFNNFRQIVQSQMFDRVLDTPQVFIDAIFL